MPVYRSAQQSPSAKAQNESVVVTVPVVDVGLPGGRDDVEIELTLLEAKQLALSLRDAIERASRNVG